MALGLKTLSCRYHHLRTGLAVNGAVILMILLFIAVSDSHFQALESDFL
jgi:hypothetical protein